MKNDLLIVEFDGQQNQQFYFQPLGRTVRGRFDSRRVPNAGRLYNAWPTEIPSQRLELNVATGEAAIVEPLWDAQHSATRERIEAKRWSLAPGRETVQAHVPTWLYWLRSLVESGNAKLVNGSLPDKVDGKPQTRFHSTVQPDATERLTSAIENQTAAMEKLLAKLAK
jgi:hypothetical protein